MDLSLFNNYNTSRAINFVLLLFLFAGKITRECAHEASFVYTFWANVFLCMEDSYFFDFELVTYPDYYETLFVSSALFLISQYFQKDRFKVNEPPLYKFTFEFDIDSWYNRCKYYLVHYYSEQLHFHIATVRLLIGLKYYTMHKASCSFIWEFYLRKYQKANQMLKKLDDYVIRLRNLSEPVCMCTSYNYTIICVWYDLMVDIELGYIEDMVGTKLRQTRLIFLTKYLTLLHAFDCKRFKFPFTFSLVVNDPNPNNVTINMSLLQKIGYSYDIYGCFIYLQHWICRQSCQQKKQYFHMFRTVCHPLKNETNKMSFSYGSIGYMILVTGMCQVTLAENVNDVTEGLDECWNTSVINFLWYVKNITRFLFQTPTIYNEYLIASLITGPVVTIQSYLQCYKTKADLEYDDYYILVSDLQALLRKELGNWSLQSHFNKLLISLDVTAFTIFHSPVDVLSLTWKLLQYDLAITEMYLEYKSHLLEKEFVNISNIWSYLDNCYACIWQCLKQKNLNLENHIHYRHISLLKLAIAINKKERMTYIINDYGRTDISPNSLQVKCLNILRTRFTQIFDFKVLPTIASLPNNNADLCSVPLDVNVHIPFVNGLPIFCITPCYTSLPFWESDIFNLPFYYGPTLSPSSNRLS